MIADMVNHDYCWQWARDWTWNFTFREEARESALTFLLCAQRTKTCGDKVIRRRIALFIFETWRDFAWVRVHHRMKMRQERLL